MGIKRELSAKFNRALVNHPRKSALTLLNGGIWTTMGAGIILTPFDMGFTLLGGILMSVSIPVALAPHGDDGFADNKTLTTLIHEGEKYSVTRSQACAYASLTKKINDLNIEYKKYYKNQKKAEKIRKAALAHKQTQIDILASENVYKLKDIETAPDMNLTIPQRKKSSRLPRN